MAIKKTIGITDSDGDTLVFIPPAPEGDDLGGISVAEKNNINTTMANLQTNIDNVNTRVSSIIAQSGTSDTEVVAARTNSITGEGYTTLADRLDQENSQLSESIAEISELSIYTKSVGGYTELAYIPENPELSVSNRNSNIDFEIGMVDRHVQIKLNTVPFTNSANIRYLAQHVKNPTIAIVPVENTAMRIKVEGTGNMINSLYCHIVVTSTDDGTEQTSLTNINLITLYAYNRDKASDGWYYMSSSDIAKKVTKRCFYPTGIYISSSIGSVDENNISITFEIGDESVINECGWILGERNNVPITPTLDKIQLDINSVEGRVQELENKPEPTTVSNTIIEYDFTHCKPYSIEHRGHKSVAPENTLEAYRLSKRAGFDFVETDVSLTSDGIPLILHDETIDRTSNGTGLLSEMTFEQARAYDYSYLNGRKISGYENVSVKIPTFEEVVTLCKNIGLYLYIDLKEGMSDESLDLLVSIVRKYNMLRSVTWISAYDVMLRRITENDKEARVGIHRSSWTQSAINTLASLKTGKNEVFADASITGLTSEYMEALLSNGFPVETYAPNTKEAILSLDSRISGVTSEIYPYKQVLYEANIGDANTGIVV